MHNYHDALGSLPLGQSRNATNTTPGNYGAGRSGAPWP